MQTNERTNEQIVIDSLKFRVELAMIYGGVVEDCVTPAQAVELVKRNEDITRRRSRNGGGVFKIAA